MTATPNGVATSINYAGFIERLMLNNDVAARPNPVGVVGCVKSLSQGSREAGNPGLCFVTASRYCSAELKDFFRFLKYVFPIPTVDLRSGSCFDDGSR